MWLFGITLPLFAYATICLQELTDSIEHSQITLETSFDTNVHVEARTSYPQLPETNAFWCYVNDHIKEEAHAIYDHYIQKMGSPQENYSEEEEFNERTLSYGLQPVYCSSNIISLFGREYRYSGGVHGSVYYLTKTFWQNGNIMHELSLDDLFLPEGCERLFRYCDSYFKSHKWGYYSYDDYSWVNFGPEHLDAFLLTKQGVLLLFQNYVVSGFDDFPTTLLIPYPLLATIANPDGPLPKLVLDDHWLTTKAQNITTNPSKSQ